MNERANIPVVWQETPFAVYSGKAPQRLSLPEGLSIAEMVAIIPRLPVGFAEHGVVCINGDPVARSDWEATYPRLGTKPVSITLHVSLGGGDGRGPVKNVVSIVAAVALVALTSWISGGAAAGLLGPAFASGAFGARLLAAGVGIVGSLALAALSPPPTDAFENAPDSRASINGNILQPGTPLPAVVGTHRVFPPLIQQPRFEIVDTSEYVSAVYALAGPHKLEDIRLGDVPIGDADDIEIETREGWSTDAALTLVTQQVHTFVPGFSELSGYRWGDDDADNWSNVWKLDQDNYEFNELFPKWHRVVTRASPDEVELHLTWPGGLSIPSVTDCFMPMRIRIRKVGDSSWINLPEILWYGDNSTSTFNKYIRLIWDGSPPAGPPYPSTDSQAGPKPFAVYIVVPVSSGILYGPNGIGGWTAHSHFDANTGGDHYFGADPDALGSANTGTTDVQNVALYKDRVEFYLDSSVFPQGEYEIEVRRGAIGDENQFTVSTYVYNADVLDFFGYVNDGNGSPSVISQLRVDQTQSEQVTLTRVVSVWDAAPVAAGQGVALIALKARNRAVQQLSVKASGYVQDYEAGSPSGWITWTTTSNPAPHFRRVLTSSLNKRPLSDWQIDEASLIAWRTHCASEGYECNAILDGRSVADALNLIAGCGYARPFRSEVWGVAYDRNRVNDDVVQVFSPRNMRSFSWQKAFPVLPDHFICSYLDETNNYLQAETIVYADGYTAANAVTPERVEYRGLTTLAAVQARAAYDLAAARVRSTFYSGEAWIEHIVCRRGDLVGIQHDILAKQVGSARIKSVTQDGNSPSLISGLVLDSVVPLNLDDNGNADATITTGIAIRLRDGTVLVKTVTYTGAESSTISFATPFEDPGDILAAGCLVVVGPRTEEYKRVIVVDIEPRSDMSARLTFVDEAPELFVGVGKASARIAVTATGNLGGVGSAAVAISGSADGKVIKSGVGSAAIAFTGSADGHIKIRLVGYASGRAQNGGDVTIDLTALSGGDFGDGDVMVENDYVIVLAAGSGALFNGADAIAMTTTGYSSLATGLNATDTEFARVKPFAKFMTATPDTSAVIDFASAVPSANNSHVGIAIVLRGVNQSTQMDVAVQPVTQTNTALFNPASITPASLGALVVIMGAGAHTGGAANDFTYGTYDGLLSESENDTDDVTAIIAHWSGWSSGAHDPPAVGWAGTDSTSFSAAGFTLAIRPKT